MTAEYGKNKDLLVRHIHIYVYVLFFTEGAIANKAPNNK